MKRLWFTLAFGIAGVAAAQDLVSEVYLPMGTAGGSNCTIGPQLPSGSTCPGPDTPDGSHDGYHPQRPIRGFSQLHVSGTGWGQYANMLLSPQVGLAVGETEHDSEKADEEAWPDHYAVTLKRWGIRAEVAPTHNGAMYRFTYPAGEDSTLLLDVTHSLADIVPDIRGRFFGGRVEITSLAPLTVEASGKYQGGFGQGPYSVYIAMACDRDATEAGTWNGAVSTPGKRVEEAGGRIGAWGRFDTREKPAISVRVGVSLASIENARRYLREQLAGRDYDAVRADARSTWNEMLGRIQVEGGSADDRRIFYTALYHTMLQPRDRSGDNARWKSDEPFWDDQYAVWDTWRTALPLRVLIDPKSMRGIVRSFIDRYEHGGRVADAFVAGVESSDQGGNDPDNVIADCFVKDLGGVDWERAWKLLEAHANTGRNDEYRKRGWIPAGRMSCSNTLEMAYNDACAAEVARALGKAQAADELAKRSNGWQELWREDAASGGFTGFIAPKAADGKWVDPFDPRKVQGSWTDFFYEGSSWNYSFFVPHDVPTLIEKCGGKERFVERLEYACQNRLVEMWNEPAFLTLRLFTYAGRPDLTSKWVRQTMRSSWNLKRGYPGNEDSGAMGSWYVWSAMGLFPVAGQDLYIVNVPVFDKVTIQLEGGKKFVIERRDASERNTQIVGATLNGARLNRAYLRHNDLAPGGTLVLDMGDQVNDWGKADLPPRH